MPQLQTFIDYFLAEGKLGYDIPKTLTFSIVLIIAALIIFETLKKLKIKIDRRLAVAVAPYVVFGGMLRVLRDIGLLHSAIFATPGIYFFIFSITFLVLLVSLLVEKKFKVPYFKTLFLFGIVLVALVLKEIRVVNLYGSLLVLAAYFPWILFFYILKKWSVENRIVTSIQMFDASTTFIATKFFGYGEQHPLPLFFINLIDPFSFVILKLVGVVLVLVLIDKLSEDKEFANYLKLIIAILGGATGTRDFTCLVSSCTPS